MCASYVLYIEHKYNITSSSISYIYIYTHTLFLLCVLRLLEAMFLLPETCLLFMFVPTQPNGPSKVNSFWGPTPRHLDSRNRMFQTHGIYIFGVLMFGQCCLALHNGKFTCLTMFFLPYYGLPKKLDALSRCLEAILRRLISHQNGGDVTRTTSW